MGVEIWKDIPSYEGFYQASNYGGIRGVNRIVEHEKCGQQLVWGKMLKQPCCADGYLAVVLYKHNKPLKYRVHRLILMTFMGIRPVGLGSRHLNGNKKDNTLNNLTWGTQQENCNDRDLHGNTFRPIGEKHPKTKLKDVDVVKIKELITSGVQKMEIAKMFNVKRHVVYFIAQNKTWRHIAWQ